MSLLMDQYVHESLKIRGSGGDRLVQSDRDTAVESSLMLSFAQNNIFV